MDVSVLISSRQKYETKNNDYNKHTKIDYSEKKQVKLKEIGKLSQVKKPIYVGQL